MDYISTAKLAECLEKNAKDLFNVFETKGWIYKSHNFWQLTSDGKKAGGKMQYNPKYGDYIVWPKNIDIEIKVRRLLKSKY